MSAKQEKKKRQVYKRIDASQTKLYYEVLAAWESIKPPRWRIFKYRKWLRLKPQKPKGCK